MSAKFEDTKGVIGMLKSKKDRQYNGQEKMGQTNLQNSTHNIRATQTPLKNGDELGCSGVDSNNFSE